MQETLTISNLADVPKFLEAAAKGMWQEWWEEEGHPIEDVYDELQKSLGPEALPTTLIAHQGDKFLGMVMFVQSDMSKRPQYTPWLASLWISPDHRRRSIGTRLTKELETLATQQGHPHLYLFAKLSLRSFFEGLGWQCIEADVSGVDIFRKDLR